MRTVLIRATLLGSSLATAFAISGCAIVINPNDGDMRYESVSGSSGVRGDGLIGKDVRQVAALKSLDINNVRSIDMTINVRVGSEPSLVIEADNNLLPMIHTETSGDTLKIWTDGNLRSSSNGIRVTYTTPRLTQIKAYGSGRVVLGGLNGDALYITQSGSMRMQLAGSVGRLDIDRNGSGTLDASAMSSTTANIASNGSGRVELGPVRGEQFSAVLQGSGSLSASGAVRNLDVRINGSGDASLAALSSEMADLSSNGAGDISVTVTRKLQARANGSGRITVRGNPAQRSIVGNRVTIIE